MVATTLLLAAGASWAQQRATLEVEVRGLPGDSNLDEAEVLAVRLQARRRAQLQAQAEGCKTLGGRCRIELIPGTYQITVRKKGYFDPAYVLRDDVTELVEVAGAGTTRARFELVEGGSLSGQIFSEDGSPVAQAMLRARLVDTPVGRAPVQLWAHSNAEGEFSLTDLPPGRYGLSIVPPERLRRRGLERSAISGEFTGYAVQTIHPGVEEVTWVAPVEIPAGMKLPHRTVVLRKARVFAIEGQLWEANRDEPLAAASAGLRTADEFRSILFDARPVGKDGSFFFPSLGEGDYELLIFREGKELPWTVPVRVSSAGNAPLVLRVPEWQSLQIKLKGDLPPLRDARRIELEKEGWGGTLAAPVGAQREISFAGLPPGHYRLSLHAEDEIYLVSARQGGTDVLEQGISVGEALPLPVEAQVQAGAARLEGALVDENAETVRRGWVIAAAGNPISRARGAGVYITPVVRGGFDFPLLPPGEYELYGFRKRPDSTLSAIEFWRKLSGQGIRVTLTAHQRLETFVPVVQP